MKLNFKQERVLAVVAHPDDAELLCAGTLARAREDGAAIGVAVLCVGDKGQPNPPLRNLAAVRRREMKSAAVQLGAQLFPGRSLDSTLADDAARRSWLTEVFRRFSPTLVLAHAPEDYHPDHQAASKLAEAASWFCASRGYRGRTAALSEAPAVWWMDTVTMAGFEPALYIDISRHAELKERLLACHASQLSRQGERDFAPLMELMRRQCRTRGFQAGVAAAEAFRPHLAFKRARAW